MTLLPKVRKGIASLLSKTEKVRKAVLGVAMATALVAATAMVPVDANAATSDYAAPVLLSASMDSQPSYHQSHRSHYSHQSHQSHYSSRY
jgi:hypothetical protein